MRALVIVLLLAGCTTVPDGPTTTSTVTDPSDYDYKVDEPHAHDYWGGKERLVIIDAVEAAGTFVFSDGADFVFRPDAGIVVPQGAAFLEVTLSWSHDPGSAYTDPELWTQTAASNALAREAPVASGDMVVVASTNGENDLPHQRLSAWRFSLHLHPDNLGRIAYQGEVTIRVEAVRGLEIPVYPGHPDQWSGKDTVPLLSVTSPAGANMDLGGGRACLGGCLQTYRPDDGAIVPIDADHVEVVLSWTGTPNLALAYHHAQDWELLRPAPASQTDTSRTYLLPVEGRGDGAYAQQSLWEFEVFIDGPAPAQAGDHALVAVAHA